MSNRRRRRRRNAVHDLLARPGRPDLLAMPGLDVADAPRLRLPLPRLADVGLPDDGEWIRATRNAIALRRCDGK